jgi:hypothetical protein
MEPDKKKMLIGGGIAALLTGIFIVVLAVPLQG